MHGRAPAGRTRAQPRLVGEPLRALRRRRRGDPDRCRPRRPGQAPLAPYAAPGSQALADGLTALPGRFTSALLAHHGSLAGGTGLNRAVDAAVELEEAARVVVLLTGTPARWLDDDAVRELTGRYGTHWDLPAG
ncbi:class II aldolase/adducin family protein [Pseudonocardia sp. NPDC046786]|uniref:class II aldolase/adducin family protein n=1 Tax=Pseudonocardia sp. NPDC046786 TaxID=3155471 RepID=UPI0033C76B9D